MPDTIDGGALEAATSAAAPAETSAPAAEPSAEPSAEPAAAAPAETERSVLDIDVPSGVDTFDRAYVEKVRGEAAKWRTQAQEAKAATSQYEVFDQYGEEDRGVWTEIASTWLDNPKEAAAMMQQIAQGVLGDPNATAEEQATAVEVAEASQTPGGLTEDKVKEIMAGEQARQAEQAKQEQAVEGVFSQLSEAGYEKGSPDAFMALWYANNETKGDIPAAIAKMKEREQATIDRYIESKRSGGPTPTPSDGVAANDLPAPINSLADADAAAKAFVAGRQRR